MINCIRCGADMGQSISSLCEECSGYLRKGHTELSGQPISPRIIEISGYDEERPKRTPKDVYKNYLLKKLNELEPKKPKGMYSHAESKGYNRAMQDVIKMIVEDF